MFAFAHTAKLIEFLMFAFAHTAKPFGFLGLLPRTFGAPAPALRPVGASHLPVLKLRFSRTIARSGSRFPRVAMNDAPLERSWSIARCDSQWKAVSAI